MVSFSSSAHVNPDIIVDSNPAEAYLAIDGESYSRGFASADDEGRFKAKAESINMSPQLHSGGGSSFSSIFKLTIILPFRLNLAFKLQAI
ncbi:hypothetical protein AB0758_47060 [Tolypothrix bouteillei VB521301_2]|uniref:hypothetical protein n=1 Tax=Tolypothrix bouteillei TaxID=1246981 RepID=UPI0038B60D35